MKNQRLLCLLFIALSSGSSFAQKTYVVKLKPDNINIPNRSFYIDKVTDNRNTDKEWIGIVQTGKFNDPHEAKFEYGLENALITYLRISLSKTDTRQVPVTMVINRLEITEKMTRANEMGYADISVDFFKDGIKMFGTEQYTGVSGLDVTELHEANIRKAINLSLVAFEEFNSAAAIGSQSENSRLSENSVPGSDIDLYSLTQSVERTEDDASITNEYKKGVKENRNITALGYQIGGNTLVGFDYEIRVSNYFGVHLGAGIKGFTAGMKVHTSPKKNSPFFNLSYKDAGLGLMSSLGFELGGRLILSKSSDFGLLGQIGIQKILSIDEEFENRLFKRRDTPSAVLAVGIGLSW
ncbi:MULTISPECIES: opacity family porin [unclassified Imperialibacter]|uniref:opacity family porin n=1 Tax=unclassified Imperialibacter TaxID=2629706 RepID=UPI0012579F9C|nr:MULTISPECIES: opacity family porin [unclassified Imperialibacter]CAD5251328.1 conserved exported hypothetical protein [Imperialibacter sp. 89]CAD5284429.1 conserved exported hypothetical protein [Imperialibacter sp. 75]VVT11166.1 conserved exported hypothetical protein [Imperialibacter sp. EC-SDR9]